MAYHIVPDILGAIVLAVTFILCLRSFRREDHRHARSLCNADVAPSPHGAGASKKSLAELLNLMDENVGRTVFAGQSPLIGAASAGATRMDGLEDRLGSGVFARQSSTSLREDMDGIEVTVRVNARSTSGAARPVGSQDIVNAEWETVYPEITRARRLASSQAARR